MNTLFQNKTVKNILLALFIAVCSFILLNLAFLLDFLIHSLVNWFIGLFTSVTPLINYYWFSPMMHGLFIVIIGLISLIVFKSKIKVDYKATYMSVPFALVYATIGMFLYPWPAAVYSLSSLFGLGIFYYFYHTKQPWLYYYSLILISLTMLIAGILGVEI